MHETKSTSMLSITTSALAINEISYSVPRSCCNLRFFTSIYFLSTEHLCSFHACHFRNVSACVHPFSFLLFISRSVNFIYYTYFYVNYICDIISHFGDEQLPYPRFLN